MQLGDKVKVLYPFDTTYSDIYTIVLIQGNTYFLDGIDGGFDISYLEVV
ncbi:MAG: hypothetical protein PHF21_04465 [Bacilli bacterium]|nr:hypothetical protein [Bacilli bacterium]